MLKPFSRAFTGMDRKKHFVTICLTNYWVLEDPRKKIKYIQPKPVIKGNRKETRSVITSNSRKAFEGSRTKHVLAVIVYIFYVVSNIFNNLYNTADSCKTTFTCVILYTSRKTCKSFSF